MSTANSDREADAFMRRIKLLVGVAALAIAVPLILFTVHLQRRLDAFEATLTPSSPQLLPADVAQGEVRFQLAANPVAGQIVYVPAYSHIYHGDGSPYLLTITLSVRNTSMTSDIIVRSIRYFDTEGREVRSYLKEPVRLPALGTTEVVIERDDVSGGSGANFLVEWTADAPVAEPIIEAVMIDTGSQQGISFVRRSSVIAELPASSEGEPR